MNRLIARTLISNSLKRTYPVAHTFKQWHSTFLVTNEDSIASGRLRAEEEAYCDTISSPFNKTYDGALRTVFQETVDTLPDSLKMVGLVQAKTLHQLVRLFRPAQVLEIGGFTGYSAIAMGSALEPNGKLISLELDPVLVQTARKHVKNANLQDQVQFKEGPAADSLVELAGNKYDFIFIDADKAGYLNYYDLIMKHDLLSDKGIIVADNVLFFGRVHQQAAGYKLNPNEAPASKTLKRSAKKLHAFNQHVFQDPRVEVVVLPVFDGLSLIRKK